MPLFSDRRYDVNLVHAVIEARLGTQNVMTTTWEIALNLAEIVRWQFGPEYD